LRMKCAHAYQSRASWKSRSWKRGFEFWSEHGSLFIGCKVYSGLQYITWNSRWDAYPAGPQSPLYLDLLLNRERRSELITPSTNLASLQTLL
jgi:hypothetical protein